VPGIGAGARGRGLGPGVGALQPAPPAAGAQQGTGVPAEPFLLCRLRSGMALRERPGSPGWFRLRGVLGCSLLLTGVRKPTSLAPRAG